MTSQTGGLPNIINNIQNSIIKSRILNVTNPHMDKTEQDIFSDILSSIKLYKIIGTLRLLENKNSNEIQRLLTRNPKLIMEILKSIELNKFTKVISKRNVNNILSVIRKYLDIFGVHINIPETSFKNIISLLKELNISNSPIVNIELLMTIKALFEENAKKIMKNINDLNNKTVPQLKRIAKKHQINIESKMNKGELIKIITKHYM